MLRVVVPLVIERSATDVGAPHCGARFCALDGAGHISRERLASFVSSIARCKALDPRYAVHNRPAP